LPQASLFELYVLRPRLLLIQLWLALHIAVALGHIGKKLARLVGVGLILPLDGSFVRHVGAFQGFISSLSLADLASGACAGEISQTRIFLRSIGYGLS
jgi:hypothetical protein